MSSFAIWYKKKVPLEQENSMQTSLQSAETPVGIDIHVNLWEGNICGRDDSLVYFDFGLMIYDVRDIENIYVYCPFEVKVEEVKDLGGCIIDNQILVGAIFNENYRICSGEPRRLLVQNLSGECLCRAGMVRPDSISNLKNVELATSESQARDTGSNAEDKIAEQSNKKFIIYSLDINNDLKVKYIEEAGYRGTRLSLSVKEILTGQYGENIKGVHQYYFRLRVEVDINKLSLIFQRPKTISPLHNAFITSQVIDFRLNDLRSCTALVRDEFAKGAHFSIQRVHYLLLRKTTDVFIHQGEKVSSRLLEKDLWESYIGGLKNSVVAYHFKEKIDDGPLSKRKSINDYSILTRFEFECFNARKIVGYFYIALYIGVISSSLTTVLQKELSIEFWEGGFVLGTAILIYVMWSLSRGDT